MKRPHKIYSQGDITGGGVALGVNECQSNWGKTFQNLGRSKSLEIVNFSSAMNSDSKNSSTQTPPSTKVTLHTAVASPPSNQITIFQNKHQPSQVAVEHDQSSWGFCQGFSDDLWPSRDSVGKPTQSILLSVRVWWINKTTWSTWHFTGISDSGRLTI